MSDLTISLQVGQQEGCLPGREELGHLGNCSWNKGLASSRALEQQSEVSTEV